MHHQFVPIPILLDVLIHLRGQMKPSELFALSKHTEP